MHTKDVKVGMRVRRINHALPTWPIGTVGVVLEIVGYHIRVRIEPSGYEGVYDPMYCEFVSAGPVPSDPPVTARKDDSGKLDMTLLDDMPRATAAIVEVMQWAITKKAPTPYERSSWLGVSADRYRAAIFRHNRDACAQAIIGTSEVRFERDKETDLLHLAHMACSAMMALENALRELEAKQNAK